jgi:hypothetical protein
MDGHKSILVEARGSWAEISDEKITVTPEEAEEFLKLNYAWQRPVSQKHLKELTQAILRGALVRPAIALARLDDCWFLVDGQHTCHAIILAKRSLTLRLYRYAVTTVQELAELYAEFDTVEKGRSLMDIARPMAASRLGEKVWQDVVTKVLVGGAVLYEQAQAKPRDIKARAFTRYVDEGRFLSELFARDAETRHLQRSSFGAFVITVMQQEDIPQHAIAKFCDDVAAGNGPGSAAFMLRDYLKETKVETAFERRKLWVMCIKAWNSFRSGTRLPKKGLSSVHYDPKASIPEPK